VTTEVPGTTGSTDSSAFLRNPFDQNDAAIDRARVHFITGATGLLASEYVACVLDREPKARLRLLIRSTSAQNAAKRVDDLIGFLYPDPGDYARARPRVLALWGDITQPDLGMDERDWQQLTREVDVIVHAAALTDCSATLEESRLVNVQGTRQIIDLAHACGPGLERLLYVSSAYVAGASTGRLIPDDLDLETKTCDWYQQTKREAEALMRKIWKRIPVTIVRPSTLVGNAENGRAFVYRNAYLPLQQMYNGLRLAFPVSPRARFDAVPSDWTAKALYALINQADARGRCFHLTAGDLAPKNREVNTAIVKAFNACAEHCKSCLLVPRLIYNSLFTAPLRKNLEQDQSLPEQLARYHAYIQFQRCFDNEGTLAVTRPLGIEQPSFAAYLPVLLRFAINDRWQQRRESLLKDNE